ncbi:CD9 antigen isoform X2 [Lingula anatina]|uniref:Tetraspanin n=1 Tax=Lingula anatina TaxID=7574 RepID=A0A1S3IDT4_LINAN|nr:CD9 antigen isoform X2 [Lingula anatina]|eukprot:XP_013396016.1 CD9 antigen isoform X2 [Lingula anatina]
MAVGCGAKCAKFMLIVFNTIFWLSGAAVLGVGIWLRIDPSILKYQQVVSIDSEDPMLEYAAYALIAAGAFVFLVGFCGCCGALRESKFMLGMYIFFMVLIMAVELAAGILAVAYKDKVETQLKAYMVTSIKNKYMTNNTIGAAWNLVQYNHECCGANNYTDYHNSKWSNASGIHVAPTCCKMDPGKDPDKIQPVNYQVCQTEANAGTPSPTQLHSKGCYEAVKAWFLNHAVVVIAVGCGIAGVELFGFIFAICLCRGIGDED